MSILGQIGRITNEVETQTDLLTQIAAALEGKAAGGAEPVLQEKTVTPSTSRQSVTPDAGYDGLSKVTVNAMPTAAQATPSISVSSAGLITASATQSAGYVAAGTRSATSQLTTQGAQIITPGTSDKTIASGRYLTGAQTIKGDASLKAGNIRSGVSIFGVIGTLVEGGGLPGGVAALASGSVTIASDSTYETVTHNLGAVPNFIVWIMEDDTSSESLISAAVGGAAFAKAVGSNIVHYFAEGFNASGGAGGVTSRTSSSTYFTADQARIPAHNTYKLIGGKTYRWVCGVLDGML